MVEDLISTGGSVLEVVHVLQEAGAQVLGVVSIFTYGMKKGLVRLAEAGVKISASPTSMRLPGWQRRRGTFNRRMWPACWRSGLSRG